MLRAAKSFDLSKGFSFSTYAVYWIKQSITRTICDEGFTIRVPVHMVERIMKVSHLQRELETENYQEDPFFREEIIENIVNETGLNREQVLEALSLRSLVLSPASLNMLVSDEGTSELIDFIPDESKSLEDEIIDDLYFKEMLSIAKKYLGKREYEVLDLRFGISNKRAMTLEEVGQIMGVTRERIRQIEAKALRKLNKYLSYRGFARNQLI